MRADGDATCWGTHTDAGWMNGYAEWYSQLKGWLATRKAIRRQEQLAMLDAGWDARHAAVRSQGALSTVTMLYGLIQ